MKIDVAGVQIDNVTKAEAIARIDGFVQSGHPHYVTTPYSEMIVFAQRDEVYKKVLNGAHLSLADGIGVIWAAKFLTQKRGSIIFSLLKILFDPKSAYTVIQEKITGSRFVLDLAKLAQEKKYSLALVGGKDETAAQAAYELKKQFPQLQINLAISGGYPFDSHTIKEISDSNSDILLIAYSPPAQEKWLALNLSKLNVKVGMGLGGTFDYLAKIRAPAPGFLHQMGLEWLWRLITQPWRLKRMWNAVPVFVWKIYRFKNGKTNASASDRFNSVN